MMTARTLRDWRGIRYRVSQCSTPDLINLLSQSIVTTNQVAKFIAEVKAELIVRGEIPPDATRVV